MDMVCITERVIPPLRPGDDFDASGEFAIDAVDLCAIYELWDSEKLAADLAQFCQPVCRSWRELTGHLLDAHPDADDELLTRFSSDCGQAVLAHWVLYTDD